jgi:hypothetical protein
MSEDTGDAGLIEVQLITITTGDAYDVVHASDRRGVIGQVNSVII